MAVGNFDTKIVLDILTNKIIVNESLELDSNSIEIFSTKRPLGFGLSKFAFNAFLKFNNDLVIGCGEDSESESTAREKAISEVIERTALKSFTSKTRSKITSNGWAAHLNLESAATAAVFELIERDSAISHWLTKTPMMVLETKELYPQNFLNEIKSSEFPQIINLVSFSFSGPLVTTLLKNSTGHVISGHASGKNLYDAVYASTIEACRAAHHFMRYSFFQETKSLIQKNNILGKLDPGAHSLMYAYHEPISDWIFGETLTLQDAQVNWGRSLNSVYSVIEHTNYRSYKAADRIVVQAKNENLQDVFWGSTDQAILDQKINKDLLKKTINFRPHLVG